METSNLTNLTTFEQTLTSRKERLLKNLKEYNDNVQKIQKERDQSRFDAERKFLASKASAEQVYTSKINTLERDSSARLSTLQKKDTTSVGDAGKLKDTLSILDQQIKYIKGLQENVESAIQIIQNKYNERIRKEKTELAKRLRNRYDILVKNAKFDPALTSHEDEIPTSLGEVAFSTPYAYAPKWVLAINKIVATLTLVGIGYLIYLCVHTIHSHESLLDLFKSPNMLYCVIGLLGYWVVDYLFCGLCSAIYVARYKKEIEERKFRERKENESAKQKKKDELKKFVDQLTPLYSNGKGGLDITAVRTPIPPEQAEQYFNEIAEAYIKEETDSNVREFLKKYPFEVNKIALRETKAFSTLESSTFHVDHTKEFLAGQFNKLIAEVENKKTSSKTAWNRAIEDEEARVTRARNDVQRDKEEKSKAAKTSLDQALQQAETKRKQEWAEADRKQVERLERLDKETKSSVTDFYSDSISSIVTMPPYLKAPSDNYEAAIITGEYTPSLQLIKEQAAQRTYLPELLIGTSTEKILFGTKRCVLPTYVPWQSMDDRSTATTGNLFIKYDRKTASKQANQLADSLIYRILMAFPAGEVHLSILDPTSIGLERITPLMEGCEELYSKKVYTEPSEIMAHLESLAGRIRDIKNDFSRNELSLVQHNKNGIRHGYELVIMYEPFNSRPQYSESLKKIFDNGISAGIYVMIIQSDHMRPDVLREFNFDSFSAVISPAEKGIIYLQSNIKWNADKSEFQGKTISECDYLPNGDSSTGLIDPLAVDNKNGLANEFFVNLSSEWQKATKSLTTRRWSDWTEPYSETDIECWTKGIRVPIGVNTDKTEAFYSVEETAEYAHSFIQGKTGGGKSKLLSGIISSIAMKYSPNAVQMYLFDFKDGSAFKCYRGAPHMRWLVTTRADKTMFLSVLHDLQKEQARRAQLFSNAGNVNELNKYNKKMLQTGGECLPRIILVVDECQDIYSSVNATSLTGKQREINDIFTDIAKKYRSFGIHLLLASQQVPSDMTWIGQLSNNYILDVGNERSVSNLLPIDQRSKSDDIQKRIREMPTATGAYSTAEQAFISMLAYEDYENAGQHIRIRVEQQMGERVHQFQSKEWNGELNVPYCGIPASYSLEFGVDTTGSSSVGTFIENSKLRNVLLYGSQGAERAKKLTMRTVISSLRGQLLTRKLNDRQELWPTIYIVNAWDDEQQTTTNIWQQVKENALKDSQAILSNLEKHGFVHLVKPQDISSLLLDLNKQILEKQQRNTLLYIIGLNEIKALFPDVEISTSPAATEPAHQEGTKSWEKSGYKSSYSSADNTKKMYGVEVLNNILRNGIEYGIHTIIQIGSNKELEDRSIRADAFQYIIFQQAKTVTYWEGLSSIELENPTDNLPIDEKNARTLFYDIANRDAEQFIIPFMLDELNDVVRKGESVGDYIIAHTNPKI